MNLSKIENVQPEQVMNNEPEADNISVSPSITNALVMRRLVSILFNKKYCKGSLYGAGIFPFWLYIKFFGKPVYKIARKKGFNVYFSIMCANVLGSASHVNFFIHRNPLSLIYFLLSLLLFTTIFYVFHKRRKNGA